MRLFHKVLIDVEKKRFWAFWWEEEMRKLHIFAKCGAVSVDQNFQHTLEILFNVLCESEWVTLPSWVERVHEMRKRWKVRQVVEVRQNNKSFGIETCVSFCLPKVVLHNSHNFVVHVIKRVWRICTNQTQIKSIFFFLCRMKANFGEVLCHKIHHTYTNVLRTVLCLGTRHRSKNLKVSPPSNFCVAWLNSCDLAQGVAIFTALKVSTYVLWSNFYFRDNKSQDRRVPQ